MTGTVYVVGDTTFLDLAAVAERLGVAHGSAALYHRRAERNRREGTPKVGDMPPPDQRFGQTPVWAEATIDEWIARRPGRGAGGNAAMLAAKAKKEPRRHEVGVAYGVHASTGHSYRFASCTCGWGGPNRLTDQRAQQDGNKHMKEQGL